MFDLIADIESSGPGGRNLRAAAASVAAHACAILLLLLAGGPVAHFVAQPPALTLIAPLPQTARVVKQTLLPALPSAPRVTRRAAITPSPGPSPIVRIEIPQAPVVESRPPMVPPPELPHPIVPPPIKTGGFAQVIRSAPKPALRLSLEGSGFAIQEPPPADLRGGRLITASTGFDNTGPVKDAPHRAVISEGGFAGVASASNQSPTQHVVAKSEFADAANPVPAPVARNSAAASAAKPAEILSKTRPVYTQEARALGIQGEVLVEVVLEAAGTVRVVRLVKGLGHGLDEKALEAAREIQFRPARRDGVPADTTAVVHIVFQLAE